ncbi:DNA primase [Methanoplanus sp. FWC-SCC4]|uniref:DNA primase DnaG n=1 Tax=Methanochimaera problematica TaxID=2609417 RepID=A0AA97I290_9EURY|nr:DNA primase DnaG [Methanoplanus sp. FWC-SCC4]WOF16005.1 DNA primase [Methanoplanus sp. FWC-SCC4]
MYSPDTTKYQIYLTFEAEGVVEKSDVVGAIFGQTEGLLGEDLDLRDLQRSGRIGRIDVKTVSKKGDTFGEILIFSSIDRAETALLAASLETIERVGPCTSRFHVEKIEDIRISKRKKIVDRAKELLLESFEEGIINTNEIIDSVREYSRIEKIIEIGVENLPAGPNVIDSDAIIIVEGRADVINLLRYGIKNAVAVEGTNVPQTIVDLCKTKTATAFLDGDRGGDLILSELLQIADIDYVAVCPRGRSVEDISRKEIIKPLRNKVPVEFITNNDGSVDLGTYSRDTIKEKYDNHELKDHSSIPLYDKSLAEQMKEAQEKHISRFLSEDYEILNEYPSDEIEAALKKKPDNVAGVLTDRSVDQVLLDQIALQELDYIAAPDFKGIIKKPVSVKLLKIP